MTIPLRRDTVLQRYISTAGFEYLMANDPSEIVSEQTVCDFCKVPTEYFKTSSNKVSENYVNKLLESGALTRR